MLYFDTAYFDTMAGSFRFRILIEARVRAMCILMAKDVAHAGLFDWGSWCRKFFFN